jgi:hypothetical protein
VTVGITQRLNFLLPLDLRMLKRTKEIVMKNVTSLVIASLVSVTLASVAFASVQNFTQETVFAQVFTNWTALVKADASVTECAAQAEKAGLVVQTRLETIGVLVLTTPSADPSVIAGLDCVSAFEQEGSVSAQ